MKKLQTKMDYRRVHIALTGVLIFCVFLFIDQLTKALAISYLPNPVNGLEGDPVKIIGTWIQLRYAENEAIAFGIGTGNRTFMVIVTVLTVFMIIGIAALYFTMFKKNTPVRMCLAVIEAGAVGNLIDRLCVVGSRGVHIVRDFVDVSRLHFGICNIADFCITFGAVALVFCILFIGKNALFPLKKEWREQAKREDKSEKKKKHGKAK